MSKFLHRYLQYRRVGFGRIAAFRFAWLVGGAGGRLIGGQRLPAR